MTYTQIDLFNGVNKVKLEKMFENWKSEMEGLIQLKEFSDMNLFCHMSKFYQKGYILGDFEIVNEFKTLFKRFNIEVNLNEISNLQWEIRMPDYTEEESGCLFIVKSLEDGYECEFEIGNIRHALETYYSLFNSGLTHDVLRLEIWETNPKTREYEFSHEFVVIKEGV